MLNILSSPLSVKIRTAASTISSDVREKSLKPVDARFHSAASGMTAF